MSEREVERGIGKRQAALWPAVAGLGATRVVRLRIGPDDLDAERRQPLLGDRDVARKGLRGDG